MTGNNKNKEYASLKTAIFFADISLTVVSIIFFQLFLSKNIVMALSGKFDSFYAVCFFYSALFLMFLYLVGLPLRLYSTFFLERYFDLSNETIRGWASDEAKSSILSFILTAAAIETFYFFLRVFPLSWWLILSFVWLFFSVIMARILPTVLIPVFFKYIPLDDNELKDGIIKIAKKCGIKIIDVCKINFSKKTKKANAAMVGMGNTRRVILADTLYDNFTKKEIETVMAHEFAHHKFNHMPKLIIMSAIITLTGFFALFKIIGRVAEIVGASGPSDLAILPVLLFLMFGFSFLVLPLQNLFSRVLEKEADMFALKITASTGTFIKVMKKLSSMNLSEPDPPLWKKIIFYNHPPIKERIQMAIDFKVT